MKITAAGEDVTKETSANLGRIAEDRTDTSAKQTSEVLDLGSAKSEGEYSDKHIEMLRSRAAVDTSKAEVSGAIRKLCWRIIKPVFDWVTHKQNNINAQIIHAMEMEKRERDRQILELRQEIEELKKKN